MVRRVAASAKSSSSRRRQEDDVPARKKSVRRRDEIEDDDDDDDDDEPRRRRRPSAKKKSSGPPPEGYQNVSLWERSGNYIYTGQIQLSLAFIELVLDKVESGELELTDGVKDDNEYVKLSIILRENSSETDRAPELIGAVLIPEEQDKKPARRSHRRRR